MSTATELETKRGARFELPIFLPVYQPRERVFRLAAWEGAPRIEGLIVNAFFLYKQREIRAQLTTEQTLSEYVGFDGLMVTDSGAFQGFTRKLYLKNKDIVRFQDAIGADVLAPLDLVTPPGDNRTTATRKLRMTEERVREGLELVERGDLAGVQQGGRFLDLRHESICNLMEMGIRYLAIGSLVPFLNANHELELAGRIIRDARTVAGPDLPMHIYGAGDPCELPFLYELGANVFDSASYGRFADGGWYMTPFGALSDPGPLAAGEFSCDCPICDEADEPASVFAERELLAGHNLWTICSTVARLRAESRDPDARKRRLAEILEQHMVWFPESRLASSWQALHE